VRPDHRLRVHLHLRCCSNQLTRALNGATQLSLAYNADGRPQTAATENFTYDGFGKRVLIGVPSAATQNIFDPRDGKLLVENNAGAQPQRSYIYLNGIPIALVSGFSSINYVLTDQLGQPQKLVDGFATLTWDRINDEFGATVLQSKGLSTAIALRFPGQEYDAITGLHYNDQRDYDPALGRYVQSDPIGLAGGINPYSYARNNPIALSDPSGQAIGLPDILIGAAAGGGADLVRKSPAAVDAAVVRPKSHHTL
jgi:RHS repeat-associated protein